MIDSPGQILIVLQVHNNLGAAGFGDTTTVTFPAGLTHPYSAQVAVYVVVTDGLTVI